MLGECASGFGARLSTSLRENFYCALDADDWTVAIPPMASGRRNADSVQ
jgi:hypothetical protein